MTNSKRYRSKRHKKHQLTELKSEFDDLVRGMCGGFLFGVPVLYTIEVWWIGSSVSPPWLIGVLLTTLLGTYLLSSTAGFRKSQAATKREAFADAVEAIALGLLCAALMLVVMRQITLETRLSGAIGQIIFESVPFSLGVALANQFLQGGDDDSSDSKKSQAPQKSERFFPENNLNETISDISVTLLGAVIVAFSIAPTDEVTVLVSAIHGLWLLAIVIISLVLSYSIVFQANFTRQSQRRLQEGPISGASERNRVLLPDFTARGRANAEFLSEVRCYRALGDYLASGADFRTPRYDWRCGWKAGAMSDRPSKEQSENQPDAANPESRSTAEKISFAIASALLIAILGIVGYLWVSDRNPDPPALEVSSSVEQRQGKYYVPFTVVNTGGETATTVQIIAELRINGEVVEWGDQEIDFLSRQEEAEGAFIFIRDPKAGELTVRVASYAMP